MACMSNCLPIASEIAKSPARNVSAASSTSGSAKETCNPDSLTNPDLITCGQQSLEKVDAVLNEQYKKAMASLAPADKKQLTDVQRKWVRFKETYCEDHLSVRFAGSGGAHREACVFGANNQCPVGRAHLSTDRAAE